MKFVCFILIFASFGLSLAALQNASNNINRTGTSEAAQLNCSTLDEHNFGLKLLKLHSYDPTINQVFSPLALKLSLLGIASASIGFDDEQAKAIYSAVYDNVHDFPEYDGGLGYSQNITTSSVVRPSLDEAKLEQLLSSNVETTTQLDPVQHMITYKQKLPNKTNPYSWPTGNLEQHARTDEELDLWLCISFEETVRNKSVLADCLRFIKPINDNNLVHQTSTRLTIRQNIELCRSFGVKSYFDCLHLIALETQSYSTNVEQAEPLSIAKITECSSAKSWHLARTHNNFIYQMLFTSQVSSSLDWPGLKRFDLLNSTQMNQWNQFKRSSLSGLLLRDFTFFASHKLTNRNHTRLLDIVMLDLKFADDFKVVKRNFYGPKFQSKQDTDQIFQIETLINSGDRFSVVQHLDTQSKNHTLIRLPFKNHQFSLVLAMPDQNATISEMLQGLTSVQLKHYFLLLHAAKRTIVHLALPRFSMVGSNANVLSTGLNITGFNLNKQDGLSTLLPLENVRQFIRVTNFGADELESTLSSVVEPSEVNGVNSLRFDRPFIYMLLSKRLELDTRMWSFEILVTGIYNVPEHMIRL